MAKFKYLLAVLLLCACNLGGAKLRPLNPPFMPPPPQGGPQEFQQGWADGCDTGFAAHGTQVYRASYSFTQNPELAQNPVYYKAWKDAENYCRTYIYEYSVRSQDIYCSLDGMEQDCSGDPTNKNSMPWLGNSSDEIGYALIGGGKKTSDESFWGGPHRGIAGIGPVMGNVSADKFWGATTSEDSIFGW